jgi:hypothetical protein
MIFEFRRITRNLLQMMTNDAQRCANLCLKNFIDITNLARITIFRAYKETLLPSARS